jgi:Flp pilus assembly protein TadD
MPARLRIGVTAVLALVAGASLALPWLSQLETREAGKVWQQDLGKAYDRLDRAADLNPLSEQPLVTEGAIALQARDLDRAADSFGQARDREDRNYLAVLELGAVRSAQGRSEEARGLLARAVSLSPRDPLAKDALAVVESGQTLDVYALNARILGRTRKLLD